MPIMLKLVSKLIGHMRSSSGARSTPAATLARLMGPAHLNPPPILDATVRTESISNTAGTCIMTCGAARSLGPNHQAQSKRLGQSVKCTDVCGHQPAADTSLTAAVNARTSMLLSALTTGLCHICIVHGCHVSHAALPTRRAVQNMAVRPAPTHCPPRRPLPVPYARPPVTLVWDLPTSAVLFSFAGS